MFMQQVCLMVFTLVFPQAINVSTNLVRLRFAFEAHGQVRSENARLQSLYFAANVGLGLQQVPLVHGLSLRCVLVGTHNVGLQ